MNFPIVVEAFTQYNIYNNLKKRLFNNIILTSITRVESNKLIKLYYFNNFFFAFSA